MSRKQQDGDKKKAVQGGVIIAKRVYSSYASTRCLGTPRPFGVNERFSFSSALVEAELTLGRRIGVFACGTVPDTEARRSPPALLGVPGTGVRVLVDFPRADWALVGADGVADIEGRGVLAPCGAGVPEGLLAVLVPAFVRMLLFKAVRLARGAPEGVPANFRSEPSLDTSERAEGGRGATVGVENADDSRRLETFGVGAGVVPPVPRTPRRRFT